MALNIDVPEGKTITINGPARCGHVIVDDPDQISGSEATEPAVVAVIGKQGDKPAKAKARVVDEAR